MAFTINALNMFICGLVFLAFYAAFNTLQNLTTGIFEEIGFNQLGFYILSIVYVTFGFSSLLCGSLTKRWGSKKAMTIAIPFSALFFSAYLLPGYCTFYGIEKTSAICGHVPTAAVFVVTSLCFGVFTGFLWVGQGLYLGECAVDNNADILQGIFWIFLQCSQIFGNAFASLVLGSLERRLIFFWVLLVIGMGSAIIMAFLPAPSQKEGLLKSEFPIVSESQSDLCTETKENLSSTFRVLFSKKMATLYLYVCYAGLVVTYFCAVAPSLLRDMLTKQKIESDLGISRAIAKMMICFGIADAAGGIFFGKLSNALGKKMGMVIVMVVGLTAVFVTYYVNYYTVKPSYWIAVGIVWGMCDGSVNPIVNAVLASEFTEKAEPFSVYYFVKSFSTFIGLIIAGMYRYSPPYIMMAGIGVIIVAGYMTTLSFPYGEENKGKPRAILSLNHNEDAELQDMS